MLVAATNSCKTSFTVKPWMERACAVVAVVLSSSALIILVSQPTSKFVAQQTPAALSSCGSTKASSKERLQFEPNITVLLKSVEWTDEGGRQRRAVWLVQIRHVTPEGHLFSIDRRVFSLLLHVPRDKTQDWLGDTVHPVLSEFNFKHRRIIRKITPSFLSAAR